MAQIRRIIRHVDVEYAKGTRGCKRNKSHSIPAGSPCLVIFDPGTPFKKCYCAECALPILKQCAADLREIRDSLYGGQLSSVEAIDQAEGEALVKANRKRAQKKRRNMLEVTSYTDSPAAKTEQLVRENGEVDLKEEVRQ